MKRILLFWLILLSLGAHAQSYNNEWIDYSKTYYKFKVGSTGLYRIQQSLLASVNLQNVNADDFLLWRNGERIPIYTSVQHAPLGPTDFIEFWGEMNDGKPDNPLYRESDWQINDKWSLETDTATYFLTINPGAANPRLTITPNNVAGNTLAPEPYFMYTAGKYYRDVVSPGRSEIVGTSYTYSASYDYGEGMASLDIAAGGTNSFTLSNIQAYTGAGAPSPVINVGAAGNAVNTRYFKITLNGDSVLGHVMDYYDYVKTAAPFNIALLNATDATITTTNMGMGAADRMVLGKVEITYPHKFNFGGVYGFAFDLPANAAGNYLEITNFYFANQTAALYDLTNGKRYDVDVSNPSLLKVVLQPSATARKLVLVSEANYLNIPSLTPRTFVDYGLPANQGDFLIITNSILTGASGGTDPISDYQAYRSSPQGGSYTAKVYLIDQLVDQFAFGIKMHPLSIRNFTRWARATYSTKPKDVLLIGKGVTYNFQRNYESTSADLLKLNLVPAFGYPAGDNLFTAVGNSSMPLTPIGRLSVISKDEITAYLNKLKVYEQALTVSSPLVADNGWKKNVVHVTGASDDATTDILLAALNGHKQIIEGPKYGGQVQTFTKESSDAVEEITNSGVLADLLKNGVSLLTYFGHSSATTLEFNLDNPQNYDNEGKYPIFIVMGCNAGNFYNLNTARLSTKETISERYVLADKRGTVAFLASTYLGIIHYLDIYNTQVYQSMTNNHYGGTLGEIMDDAISHVFAITSENDFYARFQCEEFTLHGDPAIRMYSFTKPDFDIEDQMVKATPSFISLAETSFKVNASFRNLGAAPDKKIVVQVKRTYPNLTEEIIRRDTIDATAYGDSLTYTIPIVATRDKGLNKITVTVDADNEVDELYETNNSISKDVYIYEDELRPVYPYNFSIINTQNQKLTASTANAFAESRTYMMEMDTTELFNSSVKVSRTTTTSGGVVEFDPGITFTDSTVYYWRVAPSVVTGDPKWNVYSFTYIQGNDVGFSQGHLYQHFKSSYDHLTLDSTTRRFSYDSSRQNIFIRSGVFPSSFTDAQGFTVTINGDDDIRSPCGISNIIFNVLDPVTLKPWYNGPTDAANPGQYGSDPICGDGRRWNFQYNILSQSKRQAAVNFLKMIPDGYIVVVRNCSGTDPAGNTYANDWKNDAAAFGAGNTLYDLLKDQGFNTIDSFDRPRAFAYIYRKNMPSFPSKSAFSDGIYDPLLMNVDFSTPDTLGYMTSPVFGPAKGWHQMKWRGRSEDLTAGDQPTIDVIGVDNNGQETVIYPGLTVTDQNFDISSVSATQYPYMKLRMRNLDSVHLTPYQLRYWMLTYDPVPEGVIAPNLYFSFKDSVEVGEPTMLGIGFKNVSKVDFDSMRVKLTITDKNNIENIVPVPKQRKLLSTPPSDTIKVNIPIATAALSGHNTVFVNFNPDNDQPEQYLFNNYAFHSLYVKPDSLNPLLDVTFDGVHILNRDIVASKPDVLIKLKDEAKWMALDDTSLLVVQVKSPNGDTRRYYFGNNSDTMQFIPASQPPNNDNTASINFKPYFPVDGEYELTVSGKDKSSNTAGAVQYRVIFQVINKPMISNMLNYPNPFTTSTAFVFTVTGSEVPQNLRIEIMTITGKIVREITKDELGPIHVGRNITEFKWDGTDQYGQKLANGIYLYRVITNLNGKSLDKYTSKESGNVDNTDKYFNNGYGKMYLMR